MKDIKQLKPNKHGKYRQGYFDVSKSTKYAGKNSNDKTVIYRSSLEFKLCCLCETSPKIKSWSSETIAISYDFDGSVHTYWPDFAFETITGKKYLVEVKPMSQVKCPSVRASNDVKNTYRKNIAKWNAALAWCAQMNAKCGADVWHFKIVTEQFFSI